jgi:hypothetical protein
MQLGLFVLAVFTVVGAIVYILAVYDLWYGFAIIGFFVSAYCIGAILEDID